MPAQELRLSERSSSKYQSQVYNSPKVIAAVLSSDERSTGGSKIRFAKVSFASLFRHVTYRAATIKKLEEGE